MLDSLRSAMGTRKSTVHFGQLNISWYEGEEESESGIIGSKLSRKARLGSKSVFGVAVASIGEEKKGFGTNRWEMRSMMLRSISDLH